MLPNIKAKQTEMRTRFSREVTSAPGAKYVENDVVLGAAYLPSELRSQVVS